MSTAPLEISVEDLAAQRAAGGDLVVLDVREPWEVATVALPGTLNIPMKDVPARAADIPKDRPLVVMCHHGGRSRQVTGWLRENGFALASNLSGGINAWATRVDPGMAKY